MQDVILVRPYDYYIKENSVEQNEYACGRNTGNVIWYESVRDTLEYGEELRTFVCESNTHKYIIPLANHLSIFTDELEYLAEKLEKSNDIVIIGLGAQLSKELDTPQKLVNALPVERKRALIALSEKTKSIGIRGEITAECLELIGVKNYKVIGCPSFYSNKKSIEEVCAKQIQNKNKISINLGAYGRKEVSYFLDAIKREKGLDETYFVMQDMRDMPRTLYESCPILPRHVEEKFPESDLTSNELEMYIRKNGKMFFFKKQWIDYFRKEKIDYSTGVRFHGNMAALLAGIPAVWITHDSRTRELCEFMSLPHYDISWITPQFCIENLYECMEEYNGFFMSKYLKLYNNYQEFLKENGIKKREGK